MNEMLKAEKGKKGLWKKLAHSLQEIVLELQGKQC